MTALRLLCCLPDLHGGGAERVMAYLCRGLDRRHFDVTLALGRRRGPYLPMIPSDVEIAELGADGGVAAVRPLAALMRARSFDVCLSMVQLNPAALAARVLARRRLPIVISARNHYSRSLRAEARFSAAKAAALRLLYPRADRVICVSAGVRDDLVAHFGVRPDRADVIHNPIEIERVRSLAAEDPGDPWLDGRSDVPVAVAVGKLMEAKGYPDLLHAFRVLHDRRRVRLLILGEGPLRGPIEDLIGRLNLRDDVRLLGFRENPYAYLARATVMLHAAHWEGFPNVLIEGMACGVPVVSTDCPSGPAEIIHDGVDGLLVPVADPPALAKAALSLLADEGLRNRIRAAATRRVTDFSAESVVGRYAGVLEAVSSRRDAT